ncbi:MAG TPA: DNA polymerase Y family protein [Terriglobia bacterium]|nr:DNA polymerase Y family protein [Terriglobia bacterium]
MYACIHVPDFPLQALARHEPALHSRLAAVVQGTPPLCAVIVANAPARALGVAPGMTRMEVAPLPSLEIRHRSSAEESSAHAALLDLGFSISPRVEDTARDTVVLDLAGLEPLFGAPGQIAQLLAERLRELGYKGQVAVATNPDAAIHAARGLAGITVIAAGEESARLGGLPIHALAPAPEILETLERWGVRTFQALDALPTVALAERLGQEGVHLQKLARGHTHRTLVPVEAAPRFEEVQELEYPVTLLEPLAFILGGLLNQLCTRLKARSLATQELCLELQLETGVEAEPGFETRNPQLETPSNLFSRTLQLPVPTQDAQLLLKLWLLNLKSEPPRVPVLKVALAAEPVKPRVAQGGFFLPLAPHPEKLEVTLARITGVIGKERLGSPELVDTHRPGAFRMKRFAPEAGRQRIDGRRSTMADGKLFDRKPYAILSRLPSIACCEPQPTTALRVFRPPLPATVETRAGHPVHVFAFGVRGDVVAAAGPWRTSGDWWRDDSWGHDEWDVELRPAARHQRSAAGQEQRPNDHGRRTRLYRIYCDLATGNWSVRGSYD